MLRMTCPKGLLFVCFGLVNIESFCLLVIRQVGPATSGDPEQNGKSELDISQRGRC